MTTNIEISTKSKLVVPEVHFSQLPVDHELNTKKQKEYLDNLRHNICIVVFEKADETERTMICTLMKDVLPVVESSDSEKTMDYSAETLNTVIRVFDCEAEGWRSFKVNKVKSFSIKSDI